MKKKIITNININKDKDSNNPYNQLWDKYEDKDNLPTYVNNIKTYNYLDFEKKIYSNSEQFSKEIVQSLLSGDIILLKNTFDPDYLDELKNIFRKKFENSTSTFHKIYEECPNFYRNITPDLASKYSFHQVKKTYYLFPWNKKNEPDLFNFYEEIYKRWRLLKYLSGLQSNAWEKNTPKDGIIDRFQVVNYPAGSGEQELHQDPYMYQKFFISIYLFEKNIDFSSGGIYLIDKNKEKIDFENQVKKGDMSFGFGTIYHGVQKIVPIKNLGDKISERWFIGLYSTDSDYVKNRHTGRPANLNSKK